MSELKPCPKCNGPATMIEGSYDYDGGDRYYAFSAKFVCAECGLSFEVYNDWPKRFGPCESMWDFAIEAWNTRSYESCAGCDSIYTDWCDNCARAYRDHYMPKGANDER